MHKHLEWYLENHASGKYAQNFTCSTFAQFSNVQMYRDILDNNLLQSTLYLRLKQRFFQQDYDPKHTAKITKDSFRATL